MLGLVVLGLGGFIAGTAAHDARARSRRRQTTVLEQDTVLVSGGHTQAVVRRALVPLGGKQQSAPPAEIRRRVSALKPGTYIDDILMEQDSALYHWTEHLANGMRVYVEPSSTVPGWSDRYPDMAREVFDEWSIAGFPLRFSFVFDSTTADIRIHWMDRFPPEEGQRIGVTERVQSSAFEIVGARIGVANHDSAGKALRPEVVAGIVRHEVGHALGLNHANDPSSVMYRESATSTIGESDRRTLRLLYLVPAGSLK